MSGKGQDYFKVPLLDDDVGSEARTETRKVQTTSTEKLDVSNSLFFRVASLFGISPPTKTTITMDDNDDPTFANKVRMPEKVDAKQFGPKVFFSNERTFLSWLNMSVTLASISVLILAFADENPWSQGFGIMLLCVGIAFCSYSLYMFIKRSKMLRTRTKGEYFDDRIGPIALASLLGVTIMITFVVKVIDVL